LWRAHGRRRWWRWRGSRGGLQGNRRWGPRRGNGLFMQHEHGIQRSVLTFQRNAVSVDPDDLRPVRKLIMKAVEGLFTFPVLDDRSDKARAPDRADQGGICGSRSGVVCRVEGQRKDERSDGQDRSAAVVQQWLTYIQCCFHERIIRLA